MNRVARVLVFLLVLAAAASAGAQEPTIHPGQVGIAGGTLLRLNIELSALLWEDGWIGVLFHPSRSVALRPSVVFARMTRNEEDLLSGSSYTTDCDVAAGGALGGFYYLPARAGLFLYLGPEVKYFYLAQSDYYADGDRQSLDRWQILQISLLFGTQYMLSERFGFQADIGAGLMFVSVHGREWDATGALRDDEVSTNTIFVTRGAYLGAVFYLN